MQIPSFRICILCLILSTTCSPAQTITNVPPSIGGGTNDWPQPGNGWRAVAKDWTSTEWQLTELFTNSAIGQLQQKHHSYVEVVNGINFLDSSGPVPVWKPSADQIDLMTNGGDGAAALRGPTRVYFPSTLGGDTNNVLTFITASNSVLHLRPIGLYFYDPHSGQSVLLASLRPTQGELVPPNRILYKNAFDGLMCDIRLTYNRGIFESDLVLLQRPMDPSFYGLTNSDVRLELWHSFDGPVPRRKPIVLDSITDPLERSDMVEPDFIDETLDWGDLFFPQGRAFSWDGSDETNGDGETPVQIRMPSPGAGDVLVAKRYGLIGGHTGLLEAVRWTDLEPLLASLPPAQGAGAPQRVSPIRQLPPDTLEPHRLPQTMKVAGNGYRTKGVVWDYIGVSGGSTYTFNSNVTYFVSSSAVFSSTVTFNPACIVKFANNAYLYPQGTVYCFGTAANPSVLTSMNDNGFGEQIKGSSGYQSYSANPAIWFYNNPQTLSYMRFRWAQVGSRWDSTTGGVTNILANSAFEWCQTGVYASNCAVTLQSPTKCTVTTPITGAATWSYTGTFSDACAGNDSNGLPLSWEYEYFGTNNVSLTGDPDGDGLNNQTEFSDGTSPLASDLPQILEQPLNQTVAQAYPATFSVYATGTGTLTYQWLFNGNALSGATNSSYTISSVQLTNCGNYSVIITNTCGTNSTRLNATSSSAFLSVALSATGIPLQQGAISWWRAENNANDSISTNHGVTSGDVGYIAGKVGKAFDFTNAVNGTVTVSNSASVNFNTNADFSIEGWIQAQTASGNTFGVESILDKRYAPDTSDAVGYAFYLVSGQLGFQLAQNPLTYLGFTGYGPAGPDLRGAFHHVAVTVSRINPNGGMLYVDGTNVLTFNPTTQGGDLSNTNALLIGAHATPGFAGYFKGLIDELTLYGRALSPSDIQSLYNIGSSGKYSPGVLPVITNQPQSVTVAPGSTATFSVGVSNSSGCSYQWFFNGTPLSSATASSYTVLNAAATNVGPYSVIVANTNGSVLSASANLALTCISVPANLVAWWRGEGDATDYVGGNDGKYCGNPIAYTSGEVGQGFNLGGFYTGDYIRVPSSPALKMTSGFTVEMWYKDTGSEPYTVGLLGKFTAGWIGFGITLLAGNSLAVSFADPVYGTNRLSIATPSANVFHHLAATWQQSGTNIQMQIFLDGYFKTSGTYAGYLTNVVNDAPLMIGTDIPTGDFLTGIIDEVSIYSRVLTATEIANLYNATTLGKCLPAGSAPTISMQPTNQTVSAGSDVLLTAQAVGTAPLSYQWKVNGTSIPGATSRFFITNNVPVGTNKFSVVVTNSSGSTISLTNTLSVTLSPSCFTAPSSLVGWWKADGSIADQLGGNPAMLMNGAGYTNSSESGGQAFNILGYSTYPYESFVEIPSSPTLKLTNDLTFELWYKGSLPGGSGGSVYGLVNKQQIPGVCSCVNVANNFSSLVMDDYYMGIGFGDTNNGYQAFAYWPPPMPGMFHHLAATYHQLTNQVQVTLYLDGQPVLTNKLTGNLANAVSDTPLTLGALYPDRNSYNASFPGIIDEVAIYAQALTATQIASIYNAGSGGKCVLNNTAPQILSQPTNQTVALGTEVLMAVFATGTPNLSYQWNYNETAIPGATAKTYIINNAQPDEAGTYAVLVTNSYGSVFSQTATLTVTSPPSCSPVPANLVAWWRAEGTANDSAGSYNGTWSGNTNYGTAKVGQGFSFDGNSYIQASGTSSLNLTNAFTVELWYKDTGAASAYVLISKLLPTAPFPCSFYIFGVPNECLLAGFLDPSNGGFVFTEYAPIPAAGMFHHVAATYVQTNSQVMVNLYIDGKCASSGTFAGNLANTVANTPVVLGAQAVNRAPYMVGVVDEASIYSRALSASEIQAIYNAGASGKCTPTAYNAVGITITSPTNLQKFTAVASNVPLQATVSDNLGGSVTNVQFFFGPVSSTNLIASTSTASSTNANVYNLTWTSNLWVGNYPITAVAKDNKGGTNASQVVMFKVNPTNGFPFVTITSPTNGSVFPGGANVTIMASANGSNNVPITNVQFFQNSVPLGNDQIAPYQIDSLGLLPGSYTFTALAQDSNGLSQLSTPVTVTVQNWTPLPVNGYWDPEFRNFLGDGHDVVGATITVGVGPSQEVYYGRWTDNEAGRLERWQSCGWATVTNLDGFYGVESMQSQGGKLYFGGPLHLGSSIFDVLSYDLASYTTNDLSYGLSGGNVHTIQFVKGELYAGGDFTSANTNSAVQFISKLVGANWVPVGNGLSNTVRAIMSIGDDLYVGGDFVGAGGSTNTQYLAKLSGGNWVSLGSGVNGPVRALAVWNGHLLVGGDFTMAGGNTNANCLALWDGAAWSSLGGSVSGANPIGNWTNPTIKAIQVKGNDVFVGGVFHSVLTSAGTITANNIAHLQWDPNAAAWGWSKMDSGIFYDSESSSAWVDSLALRQNGASNSVEVIAGGGVDRAGSVTNWHIARWIMGSNDCVNPLPTVYFQTPSTYSSYPPYSNVFLNVYAVAASGGISSVVLYTNGVVVPGTVSQDTNNNYSMSPGPAFASGVQQIDVVATQTNAFGTNAMSNTDTRFIAVGAGPTLQSDDYTVLADDPPTPMFVLTNDISAIGITSVRPFWGSSGTMSIAPGATNLIFQPNSRMYGTNLFFYSATNAQGVASSTFVIVHVHARPFVQITQPAGGLSTNTPVTLAIGGTTLGYIATVSNLQIFTNGVQYAALVPSSTTFSTNWAPGAAGFYTFTALATDSYGVTNLSAPVTVDVTTVSTNIHAPVAEILSPTQTVATAGTLAYYPPYTVRNGQLTITGSAYSPDPGATVAWQVLLLDPNNPNNPPLYNITPGPLHQGFRTDSFNNATLGTNFDLSLIQDGTYDMTLVVQSEGLQATSDVLIQVASNLKIGQFSFSEQDLVIPVNGIPLTVVRTYNSLNPLSADFGYGWTYSINSMDVQLDDQRTPVIIGVSPQAQFAFPTEEDANGAPLATSVRSGGGWDVTLNLPDGRRTTFYFNPQYLPSLNQAVAQWVAPPDVHATLGVYPASSAYINLIPGLPPSWADAVADSTFDNHDIPGYVLTNYDGTQYIMTRGPLNQIYYTPDPSLSGFWANVYGPPKLTGIVERTGDQVIIGPSSIAHVSKTGSTNQTVWFERDIYNRITAIHDPAGGSTGTPAVRYIYQQETGNLIEVLRLNDRLAGTYSTNRYHYDLGSQFPHYITQIDNGLGVPISRNYYDPSGRLIATVDANGFTNQFIHNLTNSLELVVDPRGNTNTYAYDSRGNVTATTNAVSGVVTNAYDSANNRIKDVVFINGSPYATNTYGYDGGGALLASTNSLGFTNGFTYDQFGQVVTTADARGASSTNYYDGLGNLTGTSDTLGNSTTNRYDVNNLLVSSTDAAGIVTTNQYDQQGNLYYTSSGYYSNNAFVTLTFTGYGLDNNGNVIVMTNGQGAITRYGYDGQNRLIATTNAWNTVDQTVIQTSYDPAGRVVQRIDGRGVITGFGYDYLGRRTFVTNAAGVPEQQVIQSMYDGAGNHTAEIDNLGRETDFQYDAINRQTTTLFPATVSGGSRNGITNLYDQVDRRLAVTNQAGIGTGFQFDVMSRLIGVTNALGKRTQYQWDAVGNETNQVDAMNRTTQFSYDLLNRRTRRTLPGAQFETFGYDKADRLTAQTNFNGTIITNQFDAFGRLWKRWNGSNLLETYTYSAIGQLTNRTDASGTYTWVYDNLGRLKTNNTPVGTLYYTYDGSGNLLTMTSATANGISLSYQYDALNRLTNVIDNRLTGNKNSIYSFDGAGNLQSLAYPNGSKAFWQYDSLNRLTNLLWVMGSSTNATFYYRLGLAGNRTNLADTVSGTSRTFSWSYDGLYRLTNETVTGGAPTGSLGYVYDDVGNRISRTGSLGSLTASNNTFDVNDWLDNDSVTNNANLYFDANGDTRTNGSGWFWYDWANRLTSYTNGSAWATVVYDADGNRIMKTTAAGTTIYLVATVNPTGYPQVVEELSVSAGVTNLSKVYSYGLAIASQRQASGSVSFFGSDGLGSTRFLMNTNGTITESYVYDAYGTIIASNTAPSTTYLFAGRQRDADLGLDYLNARYYNTALGRFWTSDSLLGYRDNPLSLHRYSYCANNPINYTDPSGHDAIIDVSIAISIASGLENQYNLGVSTVGNALISTINGVEHGYTIKQVVIGYYLETGVAVAGGFLIGKGISLIDEAIYGGEIGVETGISSRLSALLRNYWKYSGGISQEAAEQIVRTEGFNFRIGAASLASRFDNGFNGVVISKADLVSGKVNRLMLAEEIQHGLDRATAEASQAIKRGLSNEEFHAEVFQRVLDNYKKGKFQFLNSQDLDTLNQIIQGLK